MNVTAPAAERRSNACFHTTRSAGWAPSPDLERTGDTMTGSGSRWRATTSW